MIKYLKEYRFYIVLFMFVLVPVIAIDTSTRAPRDYRVYDRAIVSLTSPIQFGITWVLEHAVDAFQNYVFLLDTRRENLGLVDENRRLLNVIAGLREAQEENTRLRRLLVFEEKFKLETAPARVIARDVSTEFRALRINRGENVGIRRDMAVLTDEGVVGRVIRTTAHSADVVLITDLLSAVDSIVERSRARGVVEGKTEELCTLRYVLRTDDIQTGDVLISSGLGGVFPKGVPVGVVSRVDRKPFGISQDVDVRPAVDFSKLEEVLVVLTAQTEPVLTTSAAGAPGATGATGTSKAVATP